MVLYIFFMYTTHCIYPLCERPKSGMPELSRSHNPGGYQVNTNKPSLIQQKSIQVSQSHSWMYLYSRIAFLRQVQGNFDYFCVKKPTNRGPLHLSKCANNRTSAIFPLSFLPTLLCLSLLWLSLVVVFVVSIFTVVVVIDIFIIIIILRKIVFITHCSESRGWQKQS